MSSNSTLDKVLRDIGAKIVIYSSERHFDGPKLLKYLLLARNQRPAGAPLGYAEKQLEKRGVTQALILYCNRFIQHYESGSGQGSQQATAVAVLDKNIQDILVNGLSILGNAYAVSYDAAKEADRHKFIITLKIMLESKSFYSECHILSRVIKCLANLAMYEKLRSKILHAGIAISVITRLDEIYKRLTGEPQITKPSLIEEIIIESDDEGTIVQASRAIRIFSSDFAFQQHLIRFGALSGIGRFLKFSYNQDLFANILKALAVLTTYVKKLPRELLESVSESVELTDPESSDRAILLRIIDLLKTRHGVAKIADPAITCLTQLATNPALAKALIQFDTFEAILEAVKHSDDTTRLDRLMRLLVLLTKDSPAAIDGYLSHRLRLCCCTQIGETLKILRVPHLKDFHYWILKLYENLYEDKLKDLVTRGIISVLYSYLCEELGEFTLENLRSKISSADSDSCPVHTADIQCPFYPKYRCSSPTYTEEQLRARSSSDPLPALMESKLFSDTSPAQSPRKTISSPPHSPDYSPARSPTTSSPYHSSGTESPPCSDDEGIFSSSSPTTASPVQASPENGPFSDEEEPELPSDNGNPPLIEEDDPTEEEPPKKKVKLAQDYVDHVQRASEEQVRLRSNSVVTILGILARCSHFPVVPAELTKFLPFLLETIWNGRLSIEKNLTGQPPAGQLQLGRLCFQRAFKILYRLCLDIGIFPWLVESQAIPLIYRVVLQGLQPEFQEEAERRKKVKEFVEEYSRKIMDSLLGMNGSRNETSGWREGYFLSVCAGPAADSNYTSAIVSIPFLYRQFCPIFRKFEDVTRNWSAIFSLLTNVDELERPLFQVCILALSCVARTKGLRWTSAASASKRKLLYPQSDYKALQATPSITPEMGATVELELDDGYKITVIKKYLVSASPVFGAMFDGHFRETGQQSVKLRHTSRAALNALVSQLYQQEGMASEEPEALSQPVVSCREYQLSTMFELLTLCDQFLLDNLYERTLNTLLGFYFCPYSAPGIFQESLGFGGFHKNHLRAFNLTLLPLKYLLVSEDISFTLRSGSFWKIFDATDSHVVVKGLQEVLQVIVAVNFAWIFPDVAAKDKDKVQNYVTISPFLIKCARELFNPTTFFPNVTTDQEFSQVLTELFSWEPPEFYLKNFPYYLAGHTYENRPLWAIEVGKMDFKAMLGRTGEDVAAAKKIILQAVFRSLQSMEQASLDGKAPRIVVIFDFEGFSLAKIAHPDALAFIIETTWDYQALLQFANEKIIVINGNIVLERVVNAIRPLLKAALGSIVYHVEIYGSNKKKWMPRLRQIAPPSSLPAWYGGNKDFKPVAAYG